MKRPRTVSDWLGVIVALAAGAAVVYVLGWVLVFP
jgi:hypothetical protein